MFAILSVEFDVAVGADHGEFFVVGVHDEEIDDFAVKASHAFETELAGFEDFDLWAVESGGDYVLAVVGDFDFGGGVGKFEILDEVNSVRKVEVLFHAVLVFLVLLEKLAQGFVVCQIVDFDVI